MGVLVSSCRVFSSFGADDLAAFVAIATATSPTSSTRIELRRERRVETFAARSLGALPERPEPENGGGRSLGLSRTPETPDVGGAVGIGCLARSPLSPSPGLVCVRRFGRSAMMPAPVLRHSSLSHFSKRAAFPAVKSAFARVAFCAASFL